MKQYTLTCQLKSYIQPFERTLALRELEALTGSNPIPYRLEEETPTSFKVSSIRPLDYLVRRLTYWNSVASEIEIAPSLLTQQVKREATTNLIKNGVSSEALQKQLPFYNHDVPLEKRRNLRYGPHGIHEYRGKFFPQLVRSLLNIGNIRENSIVLDPMCGSGTTPAESVLLGCEAYGIDLNPLSVLISQTKCDILSVPPEKLVTSYEELKGYLIQVPIDSKHSLAWLKSLDIKTQEYLSKWFAKAVLIQLDHIIMQVNRIDDLACRNLFKLSLSNIIRTVSWQKNADLRVRREENSAADIDVINEYFTELNRSVNTVLALLYENQDFIVGQACIRYGNTRSADNIFPDLIGKIDAIVTSPPYATALPYLDTDRLSLYFLGLLSRSEHRSLDYSMIGNREITNDLRTKYWQEYQIHKVWLTDDITSIIDLIYDLNNNADVGFRRRNLPFLLARYFLDMRIVFEKMKKMMRPNSPAYVVVGNNHTIAGKQRIEIQTDKLLAQLGKEVGLKLEEEIPMEMLVSRDIFKKNASNSETIICFRNP